MNAQAQRRETPSPNPPAANALEARKLAEGLMDVMNALLSLIERETELVRAGKLREAMAMEPQKAELSRRYVAVVGQLKASQKYLSQAAPDLLKTLHRHHDMFRSMLQVNLTVLATAHAVPRTLCAASMPRCSASACRTPIRPRAAARRQARARRRPCRSAARSDHAEKPSTILGKIARPRERAIKRVL